MKKNQKKFFCFLVSCLFMFNGCGLETVYYLITPSVTHNTPNVSSVTDVPSYENAYFEFTTKDSDNSSLANGGFKFLGTGIYYKIYYNVSSMLSANSSISAADESVAATKMISTFNYKPLRLKDSAPSPLIPSSSSNQRVYIRLSNYHETTSDTSVAVLKIDGVVKGIPSRSVGSGGKFYTFDFGRNGIVGYDDDYNKIPVRGYSSSDVDADPDVESDTNNYSDENGKLWFVDLYAVSEGRDDTYTTYYSDVLHLGAVCISAAEEHN